MTNGADASDLLGREHELRVATSFLDRVGGGHRHVLLVTGEAGIGKTALLRALVAAATERGMRTAWGGCVDMEGAPGYWPWTQALEHLVGEIGLERVDGLLGQDRAALVPIVPSLGGAAPPSEGSERERLLAMDGAGRLLDALAAERPLVMVLDDVHWADGSSLALLELLARGAGRPDAGVGLVAGYRPDEVGPAARARLAAVAAVAERIELAGLDEEAVRLLVERVTGRDVDDGVAGAVFRRTGGHPFFARELALGLRHGSELPEQVPVAVGEAVRRRVARLPRATTDVLEVAAVAGEVTVDVAADVLDRTNPEVESTARPAVEAGVLVRAATGLRFAHDLLREAVLDGLDPSDRVDLHRAIGAALEARFERGGDVSPADVARHFAAAISVDGPDRAVAWARRAARRDTDALAFVEAAAQFRRFRAGVAEAGVTLDPATLVDTLLAEAEALARAGSPLDARGLLRHASASATSAGDAERTARVALAIADLGARFATRRDEVVGELERALAAADGLDASWQARLTAALARELQHSVLEDRPRAGPLSERALELSRVSADREALLACLFARHDVLWRPGTGAQRAAVAKEIVTVATELRDEAQAAVGSLLLANALLEQGSPAFTVALDACLDRLEDRGEPRDRYTIATRRACVALLRGELEVAEAAIEDAAELGERLREPDTGNVRMSQRLELVRARADADELAAFALAAVDHWKGAPIHAHGVAAGFFARAGDLDASAGHVAAVVELGGWDLDRSYLWSVYGRELAHALAALGDRSLAEALLADLRPLAGSCGVNGAVVAFAGSLAGPAAVLAAALGLDQEAAALREQADAAHRRVGAAGWLLDAAAGAPAGAASMVRHGPVWQLSFAGRRATVPHVKGLADLARIVAAGGAEIHVLDLVESGDRSGPSGQVADREALASYRARLVDLEVEVDEATVANDLGRLERAEAERQALVEELGRVTGVGARARRFANHPSERARKAVAGRIRDAVRKLEPVLPELAAHLGRTVVTGTYCRYRPDGTPWSVEL